MHRVATLVLALSLTACGGQDYCARGQQMAEDCPEGFSYDPACEDAMASCSADDQKRLNDWLDCLIDGNAMVCDPGATTDTTEAEAAFQACSADLGTLSAECLGAMSGDDQGSSGSSSM